MLKMCALPTRLQTNQVLCKSPWDTAEGEELVKTDYHL